jgi:hypothetical protein
MLSVSSTVANSVSANPFSALGRLSRASSFAGPSATALVSQFPAESTDFTDSSLDSEVIGFGKTSGLVEQLPDFLGNATAQYLQSLIVGSQANPLTLPATPADTTNSAVAPPSSTTPANAPAATGTTTASAPVNALAAPAAPMVTAAEASARSPLQTMAPLALDVSVDPAARSLADFQSNPVYAGMATALYINAAIYRSQQVSSAALVKATDLPPPVSSVSAETMALTERNQESTEERRRGNAFAR